MVHALLLLCQASVREQGLYHTVLSILAVDAPFMLP
jgi:hypothetical protein